MSHLIDKELAVDDSINQYETGGNKLIDALEKAHMEHFENYRKKSTSAKTAMLKALNGMEESLTEELKRVKRDRMGDLEHKWRENVLKTRNHLDTILLAHES